MTPAGSTRVKNIKMVAADASGRLCRLSTLKDLCKQKIIASLPSSEIKKLPIMLQKEIQQDCEDAYMNDECAYWGPIEQELELEYMLDQIEGYINDE